MTGAPDADAWAGFYRWGEGRAVRDLLVLALDRYGEVAAGATALDLGCGGGVETRALLEAGFAVTAVDATPASIEALAGYPEAGTRLTPVLGAMQDVELPTGVDLAYSGYTLPFCPPEAFDALWSRLVGTVRPGGLMAVDLFGDRDEWAGENAMTFVDRARVTTLVDGLEVIWLAEVDDQGRSYAGPKHWHRFEVLARRPR